MASYSAMKFKGAFFLILVSTLTLGLMPMHTFGQGLMLPLHSDEIYLLDRMETRNGRLCDSLCLQFQTDYVAKALAFSNFELSGNQRTLTLFDQNDFKRMLAAYSDVDSGKRHTNIFYNTPGILYHSHGKKYGITINPIVASQLTIQTGNKNSTLALLTAGAVVNTTAGRFNLELRLTGNQEQLPSFLDNYTQQLKTIPGSGYYTGKNSYQYWYNTGHLSYNLLKDHIELSVGRAKNFLGDGIHSMILSDNSAPTNFLKLNTRVWKFNYQNLFLELTPEYSDINKQSPHSYMAAHYLTINVARWLNVGLFETILFNRPNSFEPDYLNPAIFYRYTERTNGSPDNALLGFTFKAIALKHVQLYGQFLLDEFTAKQFVGGKGYWANKFGIQAGIKYFDVAGINNLDLQLEFNAARPYTFSHSDTIINYTNYNQPLSDPWGSGFAGGLCKINYRPSDRLSITFSGSMYVKGADTGSVNFGNNALLNYNTRNGDYGVKWINGVKTNCLIAGLNFSYRLYEHLYIDLGGSIRNFTTQLPDVPVSSINGTTTGNSTSAWYYLGIRLNAPRRAYDTYF